MAISKHEVRAKFPADPDEFNGVDLTKMSDKHKVLNRELLASGMDYEKIRLKYGYAKGSLYRIARTETSRAYRAWLGAGDRDKMIADGQEVLQRLTSIIREDAYDEHITPRGDKIDKKVDNKDVLKAMELLMKSYGMLIEKQIEKKEQVIIVDIESDEEDDETIEVVSEQ